MQKVIGEAQGKYPAVEGAKNIVEILRADSNTVAPEDIVRVSAQIAGLIDPQALQVRWDPSPIPSAPKSQHDPPKSEKSSFFHMKKLSYKDYPSL